MSISMVQNNPAAMMSLQKNILEHISVYGTRTNSIRICRRNTRNANDATTNGTNDAKSTR